MTDVGALLAVAGALLLGAMSPGPSFVVTVQASLARSRREGLLIAVGLGAGGLLFSLLALGGLVAALTAVEPLYAAVKVAGALYILWIAIGMWRGARSPLPTPREATGLVHRRGWRSSPVLRGLVVQVSNPKTAIVYATVFASLVPAHPHPWLYAGIPATVFAVEAGWYSLVALGMSVDRLRAAYGRGKAWVDRIASIVLAAIGVRLLEGARAALTR